jgi:hypothetical protein
MNSPSFSGKRFQPTRILFMAWQKETAKRDQSMTKKWSSA